MVSCIQTVLLYVGLGALGLMAAGSFAAFACRQMMPVVEWLRKTGRLNAILSILAVAALVAYGGSKPDSCRITFDANGGTCDVASMMVARGGEIGDLPRPVRDGYDFNGWFTALEGGTFITRNSVVTEDATYYAHWTATLSIGGKASLSRQYSCEAVEEAFFSVNCSRQWSVSVDVPWISFSATGTSGGYGKVKYSLDANEGAQRVGKITVKSGSLACVCKITQDKPLLIGGKTSMSRSYSVDAQTDCYFTVTCSQSPWTSKSSASWLTVKTTSGTGTTKLYYDVAANTSSGQRTATITVTSRGLSRVCTVKQDGKAGAATVLTIGGKESLSRQYSCEALSDAYFSVASDGSWTATSDSSWIKHSPASGSGNGKVTYSLEENTGTAQRIGKITVKSGSLVRTCRITQDKPLLVGGKTSMSRTYNAAKQTDCYFSVTCSQSPWAATSSASWVTVKTASGTGTAKLYYDVAANTSSSQRTATIKVTSRGLTRTCKIVQRGQPMLSFKTLSAMSSEAAAENPQQDSPASDDGSSSILGFAYMQDGTVCEMTVGIMSDYAVFAVVGGDVYSGFIDGCGGCELTGNGGTLSVFCIESTPVGFQTPAH